ncbi:MAG: copper amine oxidase N-terminal domain-containing protein, partial [Clostridia bacterium]|nr:copper amine oxidase N-terminal domain-containing protein [Clostridia bacterium]
SGTSGGSATSGKSVRLVVGTAGRWVNGTYQTIDCAPVVREGRVFLPVRHVGEALGWTLQWVASSGQATVTCGDVVVRLYVGRSSADVSRDGGKTWQITLIDPDNRKVAPYLDGNRVMLPLRFVSASLGAKVTWDAKTKAVTVSQ